MNESILVSIKKMLGIDADYNHFDLDIKIHINTAFAILHQLGAGPVYFISGPSNVWSEYINNEKNLEMIKSYIYFRVRNMFDPPSSSSVMQAFNEMIEELEWRINAEVDWKYEMAN